MTTSFRPARRLALRHCAAALALALPALATAQAAPETFPTRPVTIITSFAAGSGPDAVLRMVSEALATQWGKPVLVDNRPGGGGFIAIEQARRTEPDGYTLLQLDSEHLGALPHLYPSRNFVPLDHFDPIAVLYRTPFFVAVPSDSPWQSMGDLISAARAAPGEVVYGTWGVGSPAHLGAQQLEALTDTRMLHVPYRDMAQLFTNLGTGELQWAFGSIPSSQNVYKAGKLRYLAVAAAQRQPQLPDVPTVAEAGGPDGLYVDSFVPLLAPKGMDPALVAKLHADVLQATNTAKVRDNFNTFAFERLEWSPEEVRRQAEIKRQTYGELVERGNIRLE